MPGWWGGSSVDVKCVAVVRTPGDPRSALEAGYLELGVDRVVELHLGGRESPR
jgi:hypothetical protein